MGEKDDDSYSDGGTGDSGSESDHVDPEEGERLEWLFPDRERAILTESDREFLLGKRDISEQAARNTRYRIRNRVRHALLDMFLLQTGLPDGDITQIFEKLENNDEIDIVISSTLAFLYEGLWHVSDHFEDAEDRFLSNLETGVGNVERNENNKFTDVMFHVKRREPDFDKIRTKLLQQRATHEEFTIYNSERGVGDVLKKLAEDDKGLTLDMDGKEWKMMRPDQVKEIVEEETDTE